MDKPFFIVGTERSGSNLLRAILNAHEGITIPHPPHIMKELGPYQNSYGDLSNDARFLKLIEDVISVVNLHFVKWPIQLSAEAILKKCKARTLYAVNAVVYDYYAEAMNKSRWGCKSTFMIHYIEEILKINPDAQFIHLVRDGRDVAVSARKSVFNHFHPYYVAKLWSKEQKTALQWKNRLPPEQFKTVYYEELITNPEHVVRELCLFLGIEYHESMLRYFEKKEVSELASLSGSWKNISKAVLTDNHCKYKKELSKEDIALFEAFSHEELSSFGYILDSDKYQLSLIRERLTTAEKIRYYLLENIFKLKVECISMVKDKNFISRWKKKFHLWSLHVRSAAE